MSPRVLIWCVAAPTPSCQPPSCQTAVARRCTLSHVCALRAGSAARDAPPQECAADAPVAYHKLKGRGLDAVRDSAAHDGSERAERLEAAAHSYGDAPCAAERARSAHTVGRDVILLRVAAVAAAAAAVAAASTTGPTARKIAPRQLGGGSAAHDPDQAAREQQNDNTVARRLHASCAWTSSSSASHRACATP